MTLKECQQLLLLSCKFKQLVFCLRCPLRRPILTALYSIARISYLLPLLLLVAGEVSKLSFNCCHELFDLSKDWVFPCRWCHTCHANKCYSNFLSHFCHFTCPYYLKIYLPVSETILKKLKLHLSPGSMELDILGPQFPIVSWGGKELNSEGYFRRSKS